MALRRRVRAPRRVMPVHAGLRVEPGRHGNRLKRAGYGGTLAAFVGFTLPRVVLMVAFALGVARLGDISDAGWLAGFKAAAVAVVAQASRSLPSLSCYSCRTPRPQVGTIVAGMLVATFALSPIDAPSAPSRTPAASRTVGVGALAVFAALLALLPLAGRMGTSWGISDSFYRSGALVFGSGHLRSSTCFFVFCSFVRFVYRLQNTP